MLPVQLAQEPPTFDKNVRQPGLRHLMERDGGPVKRRGPKRKAMSVDRDITSKLKPLWRSALPDMLVAYRRTCAFLALYIPPATGNPTVDHMLPKSRHPSLAYEWANYRLCAASVNARKRDTEGIVDPFECQSGWFELELVSFQVKRGSAAPKAKQADIERTLDLLNIEDARRAREEHYVDYENGEISFEKLQRLAPFVAAEVERQKRRRPRAHRARG